MRSKYPTETGGALKTEHKVNHGHQNAESWKYDWKECIGS